MKVVVTDAEFDDLSLEIGILCDAGLDVEVARCRTAEDVLVAAQGADALIVQYAPVPAEVFEAVPALKVVSRYGVGVDSIDLAAAEAHGVWVAHVPDYGVEEVALHTVGLLLALLRHVTFHDRVVRSGTWDFQVAGEVRRVSTLTLGLVGLGRIARTVQRLAGPWFARIVAHDPYVDDSAWPDSVDRLALDDVFAGSDVISLHAPLTAENAAFVDDRLLGLLPATGSYLVNTARGGLIDIDAVLRALDSGRLLGVALDVLPSEPPPSDHPILGHPRSVVTPHVAFHSVESALELRTRTARNVVETLRTGRPETFVVQGS